MSRNDSCVPIDGFTSRDHQTSCIKRGDFNTRNDHRGNESYDDRALNSTRLPSCVAAMRIGADEGDLSDTYTYSDEEEEEVEEEGFRTAAGHFSMSGHALQGSRRILSSNINLKQYDTSSLKVEHRVPHLTSSMFGCSENVNPDYDRGQSQGMSKYGSFSPSPFRDLNVIDIQLVNDKEKRSKRMELDSERLQYECNSSSKYIDAVTSAEVHELKELIRKMTERKIESIRLMQITHPYQSLYLSTTR